MIKTLRQNMLEIYTIINDLTFGDLIKITTPRAFERYDVMTYELMTTIFDMAFSFI